MYDEFTTTFLGYCSDCGRQLESQYTIIGGVKVCGLCALKYQSTQQSVKPSILFPSEEEMNKLVNDYYGYNEYGDGQKDAFENGWQLYKRRIKELNNL